MSGKGSYLESPENTSTYGMRVSLIIGLVIGVTMGAHGGLVVGLGSIVIGGVFFSLLGVVVGGFTHGADLEMQT